MKTKFFILTFYSLITFYTQAQSIVSDRAGIMYLYPNESREGANFRRGVYVGPHELGDTIASKLNEVEKRFIYFKPGFGAYAVEEKITLKSQVYKSTKKIDSYITKLFLSGKISRDEASTRLQRVLDVVIKLINYDTNQVERDLKKLKSPESAEEYLIRLKFADRAQ